MTAPTSWRPSVVEQSPDPSHLWIKYRVRKWPGAQRPWMDIASGRLGSQGEAAAVIGTEWAEEPPDDLIYLPPVAQNLRSARVELVHSLRSQGVPVLLQLLDDEPAGAGELAVYDLLQILLEKDLRPLEGMASGTAAVWPLIAGYTDMPHLCEEGVGRLASAGVVAVQGTVADLDPADRRRVVEQGGDEGFDALFHGSLPSERAFSRIVQSAGLKPFVTRPLPEAPTWLRGNRRLAEILALCGELWLRLGKPEGTGQDLYATARRVDRDSHDLTSLCREGNLKVITWLDPVSRQIVEEWITQGTSSRLEALETEYISDSDGVGSPTHPGSAD